MRWNTLTATRLETDGSTKIVPASRLQLGDRIEVRPGETIPADGIALDLALGQQSPENKLERIRRCKAESGRPCAMVGDGVNDAAALAMADVGIAIRGGSEQALYAAPIFIGNGRLASVAERITASTRVVRGIWRCFVASLIYNAVTMTLAIMGLIHPLIAAVLLLGGSALLACLFCIRSGQYDDLEIPSVKLLNDELKQ